MKRLHPFRLVLSLTLTLLALGSGGSIASSQSAPRSVYIAAGLGLEGIAVGYSTKNSVTAKYGDAYKLVEHNQYSYELNYEDLGLAFWYRHGDAEQKIFCLAVRPRSRAFTAGGIVVGQSNLKDVFKAYGESEVLTTSANETWFVEYRGIQFHVEYKSGDLGTAPVEKLLKRKIIEIDVVQPGLEHK